MQDEARHVMFGRLALRDFYPQLTDAERDEREEFCVDACYRMRDRFLGEEVWERLGLPVADVVDIVRTPSSRSCSAGSCSRGSCRCCATSACGGRKIRAAFDDMGVLEFADADLDELVAEDEDVAEEIDRDAPRRVRDRRGRLRRMRIVVTGVTGQVAETVATRLAQEHEVIGRGPVHRPRRGDRLVAAGDPLRHRRPGWRRTSPTCRPVSTRC